MGLTIFSLDLGFFRLTLPLEKNTLLLSQFSLFLIFFLLFCISKSKLGQFKVICMSWLVFLTRENPLDFRPSFFFFDSQFRLLENYFWLIEIIFHCLKIISRSIKIIFDCLCYGRFLTPKSCNTQELFSSQEARARLIDQNKIFDLSELISTAQNSPVLKLYTWGSFWVQNMCLTLPKSISIDYVLI